MSLIKVPARRGCDGCYYHENNIPCEVDKEMEKREDKIAWIRETYEDWDCCKENYIWEEEE